MNLYYLGIFIKAKKDKQFKYIGIICLCYSYVGATGNEKIFNKFFEWIPFFMIIKLRTAIVCLIIYFISLLARELGENFIQIMIKDDGIGIEAEKLKDLLSVNSDINSGVKNVNKRLLNVYGQGLLIDSEKEKGTTVTINIPIKING